MNKTQLILTALAVILGLAACTETQKESSEEAKQEVTTQLQKVKESAGEAYDATEQATTEVLDEAGEMLEEGKAQAVDAYEDVKESANDMMEGAEDTASEVQDASVDKAKQACIELKKKTGGDVSEC